MIPLTSRKALPAFETKSFSSEIMCSNKATTALNEPNLPNSKKTFLPCTGNFLKKTEERTKKLTCNCVQLRNVYCVRFRTCTI
mmetsp:Transcript_42231/g.42807  ORF Transcript_42231/g.42807 Transcript_42231/m.42807 type:complete len:83 (+) Transcript_42231:46-294(+)